MTGLTRILFLVAVGVLSACGTLNIQVQRVDPNVPSAASPTWTVPAAMCAIDFFFGPLPDRCPDEATRSLEAGFQMFDGGYMLWEGGSSSVFILYNDGSYVSIAGAEIATWEEVPVTELPPPHHFKPMRGFSRVWLHETAIRERLGWPFGIEQAFTTEFQTSTIPSGHAIYMTLPNSQVIEFSPDGSWQVVR